MSTTILDIWSLYFVWWKSGNWMRENVRFSIFCLTTVKPDPHKCCPFECYMHAVCYVQYVRTYCMYRALPSLVSWVRCGTWLYRFLIFAPLFTLNCVDFPWGSTYKYKLLQRFWSTLGISDQSKKKGKDQESIQSRTTSDPGYQVMFKQRGA